MRPASILLLLAPGISASATCPPKAVVSTGPLLGVTVRSGMPPVNCFLGVPYATVPERFSLAKTPSSWSEIRNASSFGPACPQSFGINSLGPRPELLRKLFGGKDIVEDEDCLNLNVFAPAQPSTNGYPVVVFIHGGGFQMGNNQNNLSAFAAFEDVVAVIINYRTNVLGFPGTRELPLDQQNLGLHDQRMALDWVQDNIDSFGGDPSRVTIWGQSAGSLAVDFHLKAFAGGASPFQAAIMSSGQSSVGFLAMTSPGEEAWSALALQVGCVDEAERLFCMRRIPWKNMTDTMGREQLAFMPVTDHMTVLSEPARRWREGTVARVPVLTGTAAEEGRALVNDRMNMTAFLEAYLPEALVSAAERDRIVSTYRRIEALKTDFDVAAAIYTDFLWQCPQAITAIASSSNHMPTWRYLFNASITELLDDDLAWLGKFHGAEILLLFSDVKDAGLTGQLRTMYEYFRGAVGRFVRDPMTGPGWREVGTDLAHTKIAVLGDVGDLVTGGATLMDAKIADNRCELYGAMYPLLEHAVG